jgi:predicted choloylglycine hydrolase
MGRQYGEQAKADILNNVEAFRIGEETEEVEAFVGRTRGVLERFVPDILDELVGLAEGSGAPLSALLRLNQVNTFTGPRPSPGCTSMAISGGPDGPILGKNNDGTPDDRRFIVRKTVPDDGHGLIQVTYTGWVSGLDAMNSAGLVNGHNSVGSVFDKTGERLDIRLWAYHLMRHCGSVCELLARIDTVPLTGKGFNVVVNDTAGDACVLEAAVPLVSVRDLGNPFVYAANHYASDRLKDADMRAPGQKPISVYRHGYLRWVEQTDPPEAPEDIERILSSHEPWAPCRHGGAHDSTTLWSMIGMPAQRRLRVASGPPCTYEYAEYEV